MLHITFEGVEYRFFDRIYAVSRCGKFLRFMQPKSPRQRPDGYLEIGRRRLAHRVVATCWCDRPEGATHVHHINENKSDNRAENLRWVTPKQHFGEEHHGLSAGHSMSEAGKERLRTLRLGSKTSDETKLKQREANLRLGIKPPVRPRGTKMGPDFSARLREVSRKSRACVIDGVAYGSFTLAGEALGLKPHTLRKRCLSQNFPSYQLAK